MRTTRNNTIIRPLMKSWIKAAKSHHKKDKQKRPRVRPIRVLGSPGLIQTAKTLASNTKERVLSKPFNRSSITISACRTSQFIRETVLIASNFTKPSPKTPIQARLRGRMSKSMWWKTMTSSKSLKMTRSWPNSSIPMTRHGRARPLPAPMECTSVTQKPLWISRTTAERLRLAPRWEVARWWVTSRIDLTSKAWIGRRGTQMQVHLAASLSMMATIPHFTTSVLLMWHKRLNPWTSRAFRILTSLTPRSSKSCPDSGGHLSNKTCLSAKKASTPGAMHHLLPTRWTRCKIWRVKIWMLA